MVSRFSRLDPFFRIVACFLVVSLVFPCSLSAAKKKGYSVSARAAIFSNSTEVKRYYGKNVHTRVLPASTTKVMTALLVLERLPLDKVVTVSKQATYPQPSKIYAKPGEKFKVRDLLYALLLKSANDASVVLAEAVAGSEQKFVKMMNARAKKMGAEHTRFANSNGLPTKKAKQYTTPYDMYLIFRAVIKHDFFLQVIKTKYKTISSTAGRKIKLKSHNKMLFFDWKQRLFGKTGYTKAAKACFVGYLMKGKSVCIIAIFGCTRRWDDIKHIVSRYGGIAL
ncbi:MAG: D-alanyl-D-alanine carboxypeptidase [Candidatus Omnitrophica bacterium]|nr:D-alanyl-D-alanine carboxypeptidase [Candidatus Omnitrophota bacterium]